MTEFEIIRENVDAIVRYIAINYFPWTETAFAHAIEKYFTDLTSRSILNAHCLYRCQLINDTLELHYAIEFAISPTNPGSIEQDKVTFTLKAPAKDDRLTLQDLLK